MKNILFSALVGLTILACSKGDNPNPVCRFETVESGSLFGNAPADSLTIHSLAITGNCLKIRFGAYGCDGESWKIVLIDSQTIMESNPGQRLLRLSLENGESCQNYITRELTFDISNLQTVGDDRYILNISECYPPNGNCEHRIMYKY